MKNNKVKLYAKALAEILSKPAFIHDKVGTTAWQEKIINNFVKLLVKTGQEKKAKEILNLAEDLLLIKQGKQKIIFETARKMTAGQKRLLESFAKEGDVAKEKISPELIAGVRVIVNGSKQFDMTMRKKLENIF